MMSKSGIARASSCFLAAGLWLATSDSFRSVSSATPAKPETEVAEAIPDYAIPIGDLQTSPPKPTEVIDLTVKNPEAAPLTRTQTISTTLTDGFRPGSVDPGVVAATEVARSQQWILADVFVESSEVTENGSVEYTIRASLRGDGSRSTATEVIAAARAVSPEVSVIAEALHFITKPGDELDSLSSDSIRIRVKGGLTFEPSMLRWTFSALPIRSSALDTPARTEDVDAGSIEIGPLLLEPARLP